MRLHNESETIMSGFFKVDADLVFIYIIAFTT